MGNPLFIKTENQPKDCHTSPDMMERAKYFADVLYIGRHYYLPVVPHTAKMLGLVTTRPPTRKEMGFNREQSLERFFQDMIAAVYLQTRDTVGDEIKGHLSQEIHDQFETMFANGLSKTVDAKLDKALLPPAESGN